MSIFDRSKPNAIVASATSIDTDAALIKRAALTRQSWQAQAIALFYKLAEIHYPASYIGSTVGRFSFPVARVPKDDLTAAPTQPAAKDKDDLDRAAEEIMFSFEGPLGGPSELARLYAMNMMVAADGWICGETTGGSTAWEFLSILELQPGDGVIDGRPTWKRFSVNNALEDLSYRPQYVKRVWRADPFRTQLPDSAMQSLLDDCQRLVALNDSMTARILSRLSQAGLLILPTEFQIVSAPSKPDGSGAPTVNPFQVKFLDDLQKQVIGGGMEGGVLPTLVQGPAAYSDAVRFLTMDRTIDRVEMELRAELRHNINSGIDLPPEAIEGMGSANHWSSWSITDSSFAHVLPEAGRWADALTRMILWPGLRDFIKNDPRGAAFTEADIRRRMVIPDGSNVVSRPNQSEDRRQLRDRIAISDAALRRDSGVDEEDAPDGNERIRQIGVRAGNPYLAMHGLPEQSDVDWDLAAKVGASVGAPGAGGTPPSRRPADSSDPTGAPGEGDTQVEKAQKAGDNTPALFAAAAAGFLAAAQKKVGATVRGLCEPHPEVLAAVKRFPNEQVLAHVLDDLDTIGLTEHRIRSMFVDELLPIIDVVGHDHRVDAMAFIGEVADRAASRPELTITHDNLLADARRVLSTQAL